MAVKENNMTFPSFPVGWDKMTVHRKKSPGKKTITDKNHQKNRMKRKGHQTKKLCKTILNLKSMTANLGHKSAALIQNDGQRLASNR